MLQLSARCARTVVAVTEPFLRGISTSGSPCARTLRHCPLTLLAVSIAYSSSQTTDSTHPPWPLATSDLQSDRTYTLRPDLWRHPGTLHFPFAKSPLPRTLSTMAETDGLDWAQRGHSRNDAADAYDDPADDDEPADMGVLDYDYSSIQDKINGGLREKEKGNRLFKQGNYEEAWKQYDRSFVHVYTSKEEWAAIGSGGRQAINDFKLPCHLNRGLCRLRKDDVTNALWDFTEALRIAPDNAKGLYRKGVTLIRMIQLDLEKDGTDQLWDLDVAEERAEEAKNILMHAYKNAPNDAQVRSALNDLKTVRSQLAQHRKKYRQDQKKLYSTFISNLDKENERLADKEERSVFDNMPKLERIRIA